MINDILSGLLLSLFALGVFSLIYELMLLALRPSKNEIYAVVVYIDSYTPDICDRLYAHLMRADLRGESHNVFVVAVDTGMDEDDKRKCREFCTKTKNLYLCEPSELCELTARLQKGKKDGLSAE